MVTTTEVTWHYETLPRTTQDALEILSKEQWLASDKWYLAGGTAITLTVGHRLSIDLDFFTTERDIDVDAIMRALSKFGSDWNVVSQDHATLYGELSGAKISFIAYPFFVPLQPYCTLGTVNVLDLRDIAVMKIVAVSQRGRKRDFYDLYWYMKNREPLLDVIKRLGKQFPHHAHNYHHLLAALIYFIDAERDEDPIITFRASWKQVKEFFEAEVPRVTREVLELED